MKMVLLCLLNTLMMATGQLMFKYGTKGKELNSLIEIFRLFFTPVVFIALSIYAITTGLWLYILSKTPMSFAYPIQALAFPLVLLCSMVIFKEHISIAKWIGIGVICFGVFIATRG